MQGITLPMAAALQRMKAPDLAPFSELLEMVRQQSLEHMAAVSDEVQFRRLQGRVGLAKELLELMDNASELTAKLMIQASR